MPAEEPPEPVEPVELAEPPAPVEPVEPVEPLADVVGTLDARWSVLVDEPVVFPWVVSAATTENAPASAIAPVTTQRLIRERTRRPRSRL